MYMPSNPKYFFSILKEKLLLPLLQFVKQQPQQHMKNNISGEMFQKKNSRKVPFAGKHMSPFETLQVHCCSSFEIAEKATRFYLLIMSPQEKIEALKNMDRHGSEQDQKKIFNAQIQEKIFNAQMMKGEKKTFNVS